MLIKPFANIKGLAFDLDGTLVDSAPGLAAAVNLAMSSLGLPTISLEQVKHWIGNGADVLMVRALNGNGIDASAELVLQLRQQFDHYYRQTIHEGTQLYPGVLATLDRLYRHPFPLSVVTNKPSQFVPSLLASLDIADYFSLVVGGDDVAQKKPHPAPIYLVLAKLGLQANELLFVGDSRNDIQAAQAAMCPVVGLSYGYNYGESIALSHPTQVVDSFIDLLPLLGLAQ